MTRFDLSIALDYNVATPADFVLVIQPSHTPCQHVAWERLATVPGIPVQEEIHGTPPNRLLRVHAEPGALAIRYDAIVDVVHHFAPRGDIREMPVALLPSSVLPFVYPSRYCPSDRMLQLANREFGALAPGYSRIEAIREWVQSHVRFTPGASHSGTGALETLDCRAGVCRDYAHLMISLCRALNVPARLTTGIDYGADPAFGPPDFHCYVEAYLGARWYLFDPSGISPRMGLIRIGTGRDAADVAFATIFGTVQGSMPRISIEAEDDVRQGLVPPFRHDYAVSTDGEHCDVAVPGTPHGEATSGSAAPRWQ